MCFTFILLNFLESKKVFPSSIRVHKNQEVVARIAKSTHPLKQCVVTDPDGQKIYLNDDNVSSNLKRLIDVFFIRVLTES